MWPHLVILAMDNTKVATSTWHTIVDNSLNYQTTTIPATGGYKQIGHDVTSWLKILWNNKVHLCEATTAYCYSDEELNMKLQYQMSGWGSQDYKAGALSISPQLFADMGLKTQNASFMVILWPLQPSLLVKSKWKFASRFSQEKTRGYPWVKTKQFASLEIH